MSGNEPMVAVVTRVGECDVREVPGLRMPYSAAVQYLREQSRARRRTLDLVYLTDDGRLGRFASWAV